MSEVFPGTPDPAGGVSRRNVLKALTGGAAFAVTPSLLLAACGSSGGGTSSSGSTAAAAGAATGTITFGSNYSDPVPKAAFAAMIDGFHAKNSGATVKINTVDHNTFQNNISNYLQGTPDDLFTWFAGYRMRYFAKQGLATPIDDVWAHDRRQLLRRLQGGVQGRRRQVLLRAALQLPVGGLLPEERLGGQGLPGAGQLGRLRRAAEEDEDATAWSRWPWGRRTAGRPSARSTSSTCGSTATSSTWT